ncbi:MAG: aminotransferase class I/II-fold pyridoxal phosphate-dependent enzyme [Pseudoclavibacter sp.]|nr:aminotransferase class I/II-fold pyridoxal phosphate-dependent enzyme [Pseudoclavibacter sp.]
MITADQALSLDPIWVVTEMFERDQRPEALNLIIGVYRDETGATPIMRVVHEGERRLLERDTTKAYLGPSGHDGFNGLMQELVLGAGPVAERATTIHAVGGTGAIRLLADFLAHIDPKRRVLLGTPAYGNHEPIFRAAGLTVEPHRHVDEDGRIDMAAILAAVRGARRGDVLLVQGSCHNPTGTSMTPEQWELLTDALSETGVVPFVDHAYFGLGDGLEEDLAGMRAMLARVPDAVVATSGSKAFGLYNERVGAAIVVTDPANAPAVRVTLETLARTRYAEASYHGAAVVAEILRAPGPPGRGRPALDGLRRRLAGLRADLLARLVAGDATGRFAALAEQRGMFLRLPIGERGMGMLREGHAIYGLDNGRINLAGMRAEDAPRVAAAILAVDAKLRGSALPAPVGA